MSTEESSTTGARTRARKSNQNAEPAAEAELETSTEEPAPEQTESTAESVEEATQTIAPDLSPEELSEQLREARIEAKTNWDNALRAQAELENLRRRAQRDVENAHKYGLERFLEELLPIRDSIELGLSAASEEDVDPASVRAGIERGGVARRAYWISISSTSKCSVAFGGIEGGAPREP